MKKEVGSYTNLLRNLGFCPDHSLTQSFSLPLMATVGQPGLVPLLGDSLVKRRPNRFKLNSSSSIYLSFIIINLSRSFGSVSLEPYTLAHDGHGVETRNKPWLF